MTIRVRHILGVSLFAILAPAWYGNARAQAIAHPVTFINACPPTQPVWIAEFGKPYVTPVGGQYELAGRCTNATASQCVTGKCNNGLCTCTTDSDCRGATCKGGVCLNSTALSMPQSFSGRFWPRTGCSGAGANLTCETGDCKHQLNCTAANATANLATLFEITFGGRNTTDNYDVSLASGYNIPFQVKPLLPADLPGWSPKTKYAANAVLYNNVGGTEFQFNNVGLSGVSATTPPVWPATRFGQVSDGPNIRWNNNGAACEDVGCTSDLNLTCPSSLQMKNSRSTVIGCDSPDNVCAARPGTPGLKCTSTVSSNGTYQDMYFCKLVETGKIGSGVIVQSPNGASPVCFADNDCQPGTSCLRNPAFASPVTLPKGSGVCFPVIQNGGCTAGSKAGSKCPAINYPFVNYQCNVLKNGNVAVCLPPTISGLGAVFPNPIGTCHSDADCKGTGNCLDPSGNECTAGKPGCLCQPPSEFTGPCGTPNQDWVTAGIQAGSNATPYYAIFKNACPAAYAWQFDDQASDFTCANTGNPVGYRVTFCASGGKGAL